MGCGTSKDIQLLPPVSSAQTSLPQETRLQQAQEGAQQAFSTSNDDDDKLDQPTSKAGAEVDKSLVISADSNYAGQIRQHINSQAIKQTQHNAGQGSDIPVQVAACEPAAALPSGIPSSTCQVEPVGQSKTLSDSEKNTGQDLLSQDIGAPAARFEEEVQPFQESVDPTLPLAGDMSESSPWAYLQKTYSNMDEAVQCTSETKGPDGHLQAGSIPTQGQTSGVNMWSRNVHENAWGDASAASRPAASHDAAQQHPVKQPSGITSAPAQAVVDDLGVQDVDEFEAELAALNGTKSA